MDLSINMQTLKNVFRFPFYDPRWMIKFVIATALWLASMIVPVIPLLPLMGYLTRVIRAGAHNDDPAILPEWDHWSELFKDGLRQFVVFFIAMLPATLVITVGMILYFGGFLVILATGNNPDSGAGSMAMVIIMGILFLSSAVSMLLTLLSAILFPPAIAHVAVTHSLTRLFRVGEWWQVLRKNFLGFQVALGIFGVLYALLVVVMQFLYMTLVLCVFIPVITAPIGFYAGLVYFRLVGQAYGEVPAEAVIEPPAGLETALSPAV